MLYPIPGNPAGPVARSPLRGGLGADPTGRSVLADDLPGGSSGLPLVWVTGVVLLTVAGSAIGIRLGRTP